MIGSVGGNIRRWNIFGKIAVCRGKVPAILSHDAFDGLGLTNLLKLCAAHSGIAVLAGLILEAEPHHAVRASVGKRVNEDGVDYAENRAGCPNSERQRHYR